MTASNREASIKKTLTYEGGYTNDAADPGGPTNWGITIIDARLYWKKDATAADVKAMPLSVAVDIYRQKYWAKMNCDADPAGVDFATFDYGVNSGTGRAIPCRTKNTKATPAETVKAMCAERMAFLRRLKIFSSFGKGWTRRVADVEATGVKMALSAVIGNTPTDVKKQLHKESSAATTQSKKDAAKAGGTVVAPTSTQVPDAPHHVDISTVDPTILWAVGVVVVVACAYFGYRWYINRERAKAYQAAALEG